MEQYIALIWNNNDIYDRHYCRSNGENKESFINRMHNCYKDNRYNVEIYVLGEQVD